LPRWDVSAIGTGGPFIVLKSFATSLKQTGLAVLTLSHIGQFGRAVLAMQGTAHAASLSVFFVGKGSF
jgi:hypothetical protein